MLRAIVAQGHVKRLGKWYGEGDFSMVILLPDRYDGLPALEANLQLQNLESTHGKLLELV